VLIADTETGPGVFETALAYTDSGRMADNAILFKFVAKSVGMKYGITPTFMAKPYSDVRLSLSLSLLFPSLLFPLEFLLA
jgi:glutamine synthetase